MTRYSLKYNKDVRSVAKTFLGKKANFFEKI